jgi:hypothetical protein
MELGWDDELQQITSVLGGGSKEDAIVKLWDLVVLPSRD